MPLQQARFDATRPFNRADARAAGITLAELLGPRYQRVFYNVYVSRGVRLSIPERTKAALAVSGAGAYASHHTAARLWGGIAGEDEYVHVSIPPGKPRTERQGIKAHRGGDSDKVTRRQGIPLSTPAQCFFEMAAAGSGLVELVVLGDSLVKGGHIHVAQLVEASTGWVGRGAKLARRAARLVRKGVDSATESRLRMLVVLAGLPEPEINFIVRDEEGNWVMRFDLSYPWLKILIEYDGRQHGDDSGQWKRDARRREDLDRQHWRMIVVHSEGLYDEPLNTLNRIRALMIERGAKGLPKTYRPEWLRYFPGRVGR